MAPKAATVELTTQNISAIEQWVEAKSRLNAAKTEEMSTRLLVINTIPFRADKEEGGQTIKLNAGWKLALDRTMEYKIETKNNDEVQRVILALHVHNPMATANLIRYEPVMSVSAYKLLSEEEKAIISPVVTIKPGTPSLELKAPSVPKA